jgi:hypothetical protein
MIPPLLVSVDPSLRSSGLAIFEGGVLVHAVSVKSKAATSADVAQRAVTMARLIVDAARPFVSPLVNEDREPSVVLEWPQIYRAARAMGDPNDLPGLAAVGAAVVALLNAHAVCIYTPREWAGQVPKATKGDCRESPRSRRIRSRLSGLEVRVWEGLKSSDHDAIDAIGIGLHHLGRRQDPVS